MPLGARRWLGVCGGCAVALACGGRSELEPGILAEARTDALRVEQLDSTGAIVSFWQQVVPIYSRPSLLFAHGHLYVTFVEDPPLNGGENRVQVMRFSCARVML